MRSKKFLIYFFCLTFSLNLLSAENITLHILCWEGYSKPYVEKFKSFISKKYNHSIILKITNLSDPDEFWEKSRGKKADIISPAHNILKSKKWPFIKGHIALPINIDNIPNYKNLIPFLNRNEFVSAGNSIYAVPFTMGVYGLAYNADKVNKPDSWNVLWDHTSKNKISISKDYSDCNIYITALTLGASYDDIYDYDALISRVNKNTLNNKLKLLFENKYSLWEGTADYKDFKNLTYATSWGYAVAKANKNGGNWKMVVPEEGTTMWVDHWVITHSLKNNPLKKLLAEEWINFCLNPDIQVSVLRNWGVTPVVTNINDRLTKNEIAAFKTDDHEYWSSLSMWKNQSRRTHNSYNLMVEKALKS